jgi:hypothetical protein
MGRFLEEQGEAESEIDKTPPLFADPLAISMDSSDLQTEPTDFELFTGLAGCVVNKSALWGSMPRTKTIA